ncbi:C-GCAxxG-C-C family (seleno)protein [Desulfurobacterium thermolithotrophum]|uniref:C-GCAxxG-C-C family (seleno)protein n=1 Tax=Desulfurobacterium thermolithotrophum TaxID=64160 RepID=UPI0039846740
MKRRDFVKGLLVASGAGLMSLPKAGFAEEAPAAGASPNLRNAPLLPWGYVELDPEEAMKRGYLGYFVAECAAGAFWAITSLLREKKGYPYTLLPLPTFEEMVAARKAHKHLPIPMKYGNGGVEGYATICGALNGAACAIEWAVGPKLGKKVIRRLLRWYEMTAFPTPLSNEYAVNHKFPVKGKWDKPLPSIHCNSVLCHVVVSKWCSLAGYASGSKQRSERCGRITADVARQAVILLNAALKGELEKVFPFKVSNETASCRTCHLKGKKFEQGNFSRGFIACESCHVEDIKAHVKAAPLPTAFGTNLGTWMGAAAIGTVAGIGAHLVATNIGRKGGNDEENKG